MKKLQLIQTKNDCFFEIDGERVGGIIIESLFPKFNKREATSPGIMYIDHYDIGRTEGVIAHINPLNYQYRDEVSEMRQEV